MKKKQEKNDYKKVIMTDKQSLQESRDHHKDAFGG